MAALIKNQILKHLSKFVHNLSPSQINLSTLRGEVFINEDDNNYDDNDDDVNDDIPGGADWSGAELRGVDGVAGASCLGETCLCLV